MQYISWSFLIVLTIVSGFGIDDCLLVRDSSSEDLFQYNMNTGEVNLLPVHFYSNAVAFAYHHLEQKIYWTDASAQVLQRISLDGTGHDVLLPLPFGRYIFDSVHNYITDNAMRNPHCRIKQFFMCFFFNFPK